MLFEYIFTGLYMAFGFGTFVFTFFTRKEDIDEGTWLIKMVHCHGQWFIIGFVIFSLLLMLKLLIQGLLYGII